MARKGKAGRALATAAIGSFFAGTVCTLLIAMFAPPLGAMALKFGPAEYFSLMVLGLVASIVLASGSLLHALGMIVLGLLLGLVGTDVNSGTQRYTFGIPELADGINFVVIAMGMFGLGEITANLEHERHARADGQEGHRPDGRRGRTGGASAAPILRGTLLGSVLGHPARRRRGAWPRSPPMRWRRRCRRNRAEFGKGAIEGVAAPEAANNAGAQTSFIPMLTLGIPSNPVMALMIGAMIIQGIQPGPA